MTCPSCAKANAEGVSFCEFCGVDLRQTVFASAGNGAPAAVLTQPAVAVQTAVATPSAADMAKIGKSLLATLSLGEKFVGAGAVAATLGFFLPFISAPDLGPLSGLLSNINSPAASIARASYSLLDIAKLLGAIYFILLAGIAAGVLFYFARTARYSTRLLMNGFQVMIGSLFGPTFLFALLFVPMIQSVAGSGYWLLALGFCAVAAGGLIAIAQLAPKAAR